MITHKQLAHALALYKHGNFTRAATESHLTQSAFSRSICNLEKELGVVLFDRDANAVKPTVYGKVLLRRAETIVSDTDELEREIRLLRGLEIGSFSMALGVYPAEISGNNAMGRLVRDYPNLDYRVSVGNWEHALQQVLEKKVDLGFATTNSIENDERLEIKNVNAHEMVLYARKNHPLAGCANLSKNDLDQFPLVSIRVPEALADKIPGKSCLEQNSGYLIPSVEIDDFVTARSIIANSDGFGAVIPVQIESELESGEFVLLDYGRPWLKPFFGFILLRNRTVSPVAEVYMNHVIDIEKNVSHRNKELIDTYLA